MPKKKSELDPKIMAEKAVSFARAMKKLAKGFNVFVDGRAFNPQKHITLNMVYDGEWTFSRQSDAKAKGFKATKA